ncbi:site-specific tyrosine recombinase XerD [Streptococcus pacificus]|uniref:Tyrosine recombinase XerD-like n=1 Tax=Streptococcus pacificus TaxID=2740577 RepID=A0ABS0ZJA6_9STRE|nr:site-specific tyrosine recombinase XerD [Streptococcus pacificus]MBJ8326085.1 site-specific tyrosine recombinase XerD [Streptococcus pacificus]
MRTIINRFLASKKLSENSRLSYQYDLLQFLTIVEEKLSRDKLHLYQDYLATLTLSVQKRKQSVVNQFLYFLYEEEKIDTFLKLKKVKQFGGVDSLVMALEDLSFFYDETSFLDGQLIALMIVSLGLLPSELLAIKSEDISLDFKVITIKKAQHQRILTLPNDLLIYLKDRLSNKYLFDHVGNPYSRQWLFKQLNAFLSSHGRLNMTAQSLRKQYILKEINRGVDSYTLAKQLGLKTTTTLEKYYKH